MKKLLAIFSLALLGCNIYAIGPQPNDADVTIYSQSGSDFGQFYFNVGSFNDQSFDFDFDQSLTGVALEFKMTQSSVSGRVTRVYVPASDITVSGTNVTWSIPRTNLPPVGIYQAELYGTDGGASPAISVARGKINVTESLFSADDDSFTNPVITNYYNFAVKDGDFGQFTGLSGTVGQVWVADGAGSGAWASQAGGGDVTGPASAVDERIAVYNGATGKIIKDGGSTIADITTAYTAADTVVSNGLQGQVTTNDDAAFYKDGSKAATGNFDMDGKDILDTDDIQTTVAVAAEIGSTSNPYRRLYAGDGDQMTAWLGTAFGAGYFADTGFRWASIGGSTYAVHSTGPVKLTDSDLKVEAFDLFVDLQDNNTSADDFRFRVGSDTFRLQADDDDDVFADRLTVASSGEITAFGELDMNSNGVTGVLRSDYADGSAETPVAGRMVWNPTKDNFVMYNSRTNTALDVGYEGRLHGKNNTGVTITNGTVVYISGTDAGAAEISLADCDTFDESRTVGVATEDIIDGDIGAIVRWGEVNDVKTDHLVAGEVVYLDCTAGGTTSTRPEGGAFVVIIGVCEVSHATTGKINVFIDRSDLAAEVTDTNGFPNGQRTNTVMTFTNANRTFAIAPVSDKFHYYDEGVKYGKTGTESIQIGTEEGLHVVYFSDDTLSTVANPQDFQVDQLIRLEALCAYIYWDSTNSEAIYFADERHGISMSPSTHAYLHFTAGAKWLTGGAISVLETGGNGNDNEDAMFSVTGGFFSDEDLITGPDAVGTNDILPVYYLDGAEAELRVVTSVTAGTRVHNTGTGRVAYNQFTGGAWQITEVSNNDFVHYHTFWINGVDGESPQIIQVMGQAQYGTANQARNGLANEVAAIISALPQEETILLGTVLYQTSDGYGNDWQARTRQNADGDDYTDWRTSEITAGAGPSDHQQLSGIQGDFPYYHSDQPNSSTDDVTFNAITVTTEVSAEQLTSTDDATIAGNLQSATIQNGASLVDTNLQGTSVAIIQNVEKFGTQDGGDFVRAINSSGSIQNGYWADGQLLMDNAYGCFQSVGGSAGSAARGFVIGDGVNPIYGALQIGRGSLGFTTNNALVSIQMFHDDGAEAAYLPFGVEEALTIGANTATDDTVIVVGDGMTSHGDGSISAKSVWVDSGVTVSGGQLDMNDNDIDAATSVTYTTNATATFTGTVNGTNYFGFLDSTNTYRILFDQ